MSLSPEDFQCQWPAPNQGNTVLLGCTAASPSQQCPMAGGPGVLAAWGGSLWLLGSLGLVTSGIMRILNFYLGFSEMDLPAV